MESQGLHLLSTLAQIGIASILLVLLLLYYKKNFGQAETDVPLENLDLERPPVVGFAYDHEAKAEEPAGAEILALFSLHNSELIDEGDVIVEYRGHVVRSGSELDQLIDQLDDVSDGDVVEMKVLRKDRADPEIVKAKAKMIPTSGTTTTTYANAKCGGTTGGKKCECESAPSGNCTETRTFRRKPGNPKKYEHQTKCTPPQCVSAWQNGK